MKTRTTLLSKLRGAAIFLPTLSLLLSSCQSQQNSSADDLIAIQILDRNGFSETISQQDRLANFAKVDFTQPQPYQKVLRVFSKEDQKNRSTVTSYHHNGLLYQYLEIENGRAHGMYKEWHENGKLHLEIYVMDGIADVHPTIQRSWVFDGEGIVYDETGHLEAKINYCKGVLEGESLLFYSSGLLMQRSLYQKGVLEGKLEEWSDQGCLTLEEHYSQGKKDGVRIGFHENGVLAFEETWKEDLLIQGHYLNLDSKKIASVHEGYGKQIVFSKGEKTEERMIASGNVEGEILSFQKGLLQRSYSVFQGQKDGAETIYANNGTKKAILLWDKGILVEISTFYPSGKLMSQKQMRDDIKEGHHFVWYETGDLMISEEYRGNHLHSGQYFSKENSKPVSWIENGKGIATLFDEKNRISKRIRYEAGAPLEAVPEEDFLQLKLPSP